MQAALNKANMDNIVRGFQAVRRYVDEGPRAAPHQGWEQIVQTAACPSASYLLLLTTIVRLRHLAVGPVDAGVASKWSDAVPGIRASLKRIYTHPLTSMHEI